MRGRVRCALVVRHSESDRERAAGRVRVRRVLQRGRRPVTEGPAVARDRAVGVAARAREVAAQR